jgi:tRNA (uracil-5-)-methyltransferase
VCALCCRAGLDPDTEQLLREFDQVVYISCNPETLAKNLNAVADTHDIERFAVFDQVKRGTSA